MRFVCWRRAPVCRAACYTKMRPISLPATLPASLLTYRPRQPRSPRLFRGLQAAFTRLRIISFRFSLMRPMAIASITIKARPQRSRNKYALLGLNRILRKEGEYDKAIRNYKLILSSDPKDERALRGLEESTAEKQTVEKESPPPPAQEGAEPAS